MRLTTKIKQIDPADLARGFGPQLFAEANRRGLSVSQLLEKHNPSDKEDLKRTGMDAFARVLQAEGILVNSVAGFHSDWWTEAFDIDAVGDDGHKLATQDVHRRRAMGLEFMWRVYRGAQSTGGMQLPRWHDRNQRNPLESTDFALNTWFRPYIDAAQLRLQEMAPTLPLAELIALTTPIDGGNDYRTSYIRQDANTGKRFVRVGEGADIPRVSIVTASRAVQMFKYGRAIEMTYEAMRRTRIDRVAQIVAFIAVQVEADQVEHVLDIILNGDGNAGTAATNHNLTALDAGATIGTISFKAWLAFRAKFPQPMNLTSALMREADYIDIEMLNVGNANIPVVNYPAPLGGRQVVPMNGVLRDAVRVGQTDAVPVDKIVGIDRANAIERVVEVGSDINETERYIHNQTALITMTQNEGFGVINPDAMRVLNLAA